MLVESMGMAGRIPEVRFESSRCRMDLALKFKV